MSSDLIALLVGFVVGLAIVVPLVWRYRTEVIQGWRHWLGIEAKPPTSREHRSLRSQERNPRTRRLAIAVGLLAIAGSAVIAVQTDDETIRLVNIVAGGLLVVATVLLVLDAGQRRPGSSSK